MARRSCEADVEERTVLSNDLSAMMEAYLRRRMVISVISLEPALDVGVAVVRYSMAASVTYGAENKVAAFCLFSPGNAFIKASLAARDTSLAVSCMAVHHGNDKSDRVDERAGLYSLTCFDRIDNVVAAASRTWRSSSFWRVLKAGA